MLQREEWTAGLAVLAALAVLLITQADGWGVSFGLGRAALEFNFAGAFVAVTF